MPWRDLNEYTYTKGRSKMKLNNRDKIRKHLRHTGSISPLEALFVHRIQRLAPRIQELREQGLDIATVQRVDQAGTQYTRYELVAP